MGYAKSNQDTAGIHMRLYSRAFIIADDSGNRICYVNTDLAMVSQAIKLEVSVFSQYLVGRQSAARLDGHLVGQVVKRAP